MFTFHWKDIFIKGKLQQLASSMKKIIPLLEHMSISKPMSKKGLEERSKTYGNHDFFSLENPYY